MISMITGFCILVGVVIAVVLLAKLLGSGKGGRFIQAEMFTSIVTVVFSRDYRYRCCFVLDWYSCFSVQPNCRYCGNIRSISWSGSFCRFSG